MKTIAQLITLLLLSQFIFSQEVTFFSDGQYTVPDGITSIWIEVVGAGGNGRSNGLSGGGGGGYALGKYTVIPGQTLTVTVANAGSSEITSVADLISASSGTNASYSRDDDGYGIVGTGGTGSNGNIANYTGGDGGKGYWTYYGGGGGGAAGPDGNGKNGGDTHPYDPDGCSHEGGAAGESGGFPGGNGGKGAGYYNCLHGYANSNPSTDPINYGGGGSGGNGSGYASTTGANGYVRISTASLINGLTPIGLTLHANDAESSYQWVDEDNNPIAGETNRSFMVTQPGNYAVELTHNGITRTSAFYTYTFEDIANNSESIGAAVYETSGNYEHLNTITNNAYIEVVGGGGNGRSNGLSGGGGGGYASGIYTLTLNQSLSIEVAEAGQNEITQVLGLLSASSGTNSSYSRDDDGYGLVGVGGTGSNGNIANFAGGDGGKGYWTYYGGGGGGAAGRFGNGNNGGDTHPYDPDGCSHEGGSAGESGGFPGGSGGKGAGYYNCLHGYANSNPSIAPSNYGGGGSGGNGSGYVSTNGADGMVRISYCDFVLNISQEGNTLSLNNSGDFSYMWVKFTNDNNIEYLSTETSTIFEMPQTNNTYALYAYNDICSFISEQYTPLISTALKSPEKENNEIVVYPNPANDVVRIDCTKEILGMQLISQTGQVIKELKNKPVIDVQDINGGFYFLKIITSSGEYVKKIIIR